jgi:hypothetical protein
MSKFASQKKYKEAHKDEYALIQVMYRIGEGVIPREETMKAYNLTMQDVNDIRIEKGLEPILIDTKLPKIKRAKAILARKAQIQEDINKANEIKEATKDIVEAKQKAIQEAVQVNNEKVDTIKTMDYKTLNLDTIRDYFIKLAELKPEARGVFTTNRYMDMLRLIFAEIGNCPEKKTKKGFEPKGDIIPCITKKLLKQISDKYENPGTRKGYYQALSVLVREFPGLKDKLKPGVFDAIQKAYNDSKELADAKRALNPTKEIDSFQEMKKKILATFKPDSVEALLIELYDEFNTRDDFGDVKLIASEKEVTDNKQNYMILKPKVRFILQMYKTDKRYGKIELDAENTKIYDILMKQGKKVGDYLITRKDGKIYTNGILSGVISRMMTKAGIPRNNNDGAILLLRAAKKTELLTKVQNQSPEEYARIARNAQHSPLLQLQYLRKINIPEDPETPEE